MNHKGLKSFNLVFGWALIASILRAYAPVRLCAIHAIELYLNAFLRHEGVAPEQIRARMHNLSDPQLVTAIKLKKKTAEHLEALTNRCEYLISRYGSEQVSQHTELNRLQATLKEMMMKVGKYLRSDTVRDAEL